MVSAETPGRIRGMAKSSIDPQALAAAKVAMPRPAVADS
jgi:hypothetical protein